MEIIVVVSDDLVEREAGGAGFRLDGICLEAIGQFCQQLFRPLGVGAFATERRFSCDVVFELQLRYAPVNVVERVLATGTFVRNKP